MNQFNDDLDFLKNNPFIHNFLDKFTGSLEPLRRSIIQESWPLPGGMHNFNGNLESLSETLIRKLNMVNFQGKLKVFE